MNVAPINYNSRINNQQLQTNTVLKIKNQTTENSVNSVDLPSQVDAKNYVNVNFRANSLLFDKYFKRIAPSRFSPKTLVEHSYARVSGIAGKLKELIIEPLEHFKLCRLRKIKCNFPEGLLFTGKPGTGKTTVAETLAAETRLPLYKLNNEILTMIPNGDKSRINKLFKQLTQKFQQTGEPSILHIEDADCLFKALEDDGIAPFVLNLLSNSKKAGIIPIIETNFNIPYLKKLLPKLTDIKFEKPNTETRKAIITESLKKRFFAKELLENNEALSEIAEKTEGMTTRRLYQLVDSAAYDAMVADEHIISKDDIIKNITILK